MKRGIPVFASALILMFVSGCLVRSLHPLYTEKDIIYDPSLIGVWIENEEGKIKWEFTKGDGKNYKLIHTDEQGDKAEFEVHLVKLGSRRFLDIYLTSLGGDEIANKLNNFALFHLWPIHTFMKVESIGDKLELGYFNLDWLGKKLKDNPKVLSHIRIGKEEDNNILLTATPEELQDFILQNIDDAFPGTSVTLKKKTNNP